MKIDVLENNGSIFRFSISDSSAAVVNAIRRAAMNSVKTFAIDKITFYENTTAMFDEYISHRIGLVPIKTPSKGYSDTDEIVFTLDATGPKTVYSGDLETSDKEIKVANDAIPIIKLAEGQKLRIECKAVMGSGSRHSKFQPGLVTYDKEKEGFNFYVESFGQMPPKEIVNKAFEAIKEELKDVEKEAKKL